MPPVHGTFMARSWHGIPAPGRALGTSVVPVGDLCHPESVLDPTAPAKPVGLPTPRQLPRVTGALSEASREALRGLSPVPVGFGTLPRALAELAALPTSLAALSTGLRAADEPSAMGAFSRNAAALKAAGEAVAAYRAQLARDGRSEDFASLTGRSAALFRGRSDLRVRAARIVEEYRAHRLDYVGDLAALAIRGDARALADMAERADAGESQALEVLAIVGALALVALELAAAEALRALSKVRASDEDARRSLAGVEPPPLPPPLVVLAGAVSPHAPTAPHGARGHVPFLKAS